MSSAPLGTSPSAGWYEYRAAKNAPRQALRIMSGDDGWVVLLGGAVQSGSGAQDWMDVPLLRRWPFRPITEDEYLALLWAAETAPPGDPLTEPKKPVNLRGLRSLF